MGHALLSMETVQNHPDFTLTRGEWGFVIVMKDSLTISRMIIVIRSTPRGLVQRMRPGCAEELLRITKLGTKCSVDVSITNAKKAKLNGRIRSVTKWIAETCLTCVWRMTMERWL